MGRRQWYPLIGGLLFFLFFIDPSFVYSKTSPFKNFDHPRLIETKELVPLVRHPAVRIVDMRTSLLDYLKAHLPNAVYLNFEALQVPRNGIPAQALNRIGLEKILGEYLGISNEMWVVLYSERSNPNATYLAWVLDCLGHKRVGIINGGWEKWTSEKLPITQDFPSVSPKKFFGKVINESLAEKQMVRDRLFSRHAIMVDVRPEKQYSGEEGEEIRRGHIPGSRNIDWETTLEGEEVRIWKKKGDLEKLFTESGVVKEKEIIVYSRAGREASHLYFTLKYVLGYPNVRLYRGSWVQWSADMKMPTKTGVEP